MVGNVGNYVEGNFGLAKIIRDMSAEPNDRALRRMGRNGTTAWTRPTCEELLTKLRKQTRVHLLDHFKFPLRQVHARPGPTHPRWGGGGYV